MGLIASVRAGFKSAALARRPWLLLIGILVIVTLIALPVVTYPLGRDQGEFATIGRGLLEGKIPYVDLWNPKPPAVFYIYALAMTLFGRTTIALRVIDLLLFPPIAVTLYWIGRRLASPVIGLWAVLLFGVFYFTETFWTLTQNDGIVLLPMLLAVAFAIKAADTGRSMSAVWALASGAMCAYAIWFKYPFAIFIGVAVFAYIWVRRQSHSPLRWRDILAYTAGGLLVGLGGIAYMVAIGAWDQLLQSALVTASYTAQGVGDLTSAFASALGFRWQQWGLLFLLALVALIFALRRFNKRSLGWIVVVWLILSTAIMLVQLKFYDYHWLPMLPPLALIGAFALEHVLGWIPGVITPDKSPDAQPSAGQNFRSASRAKIASFGSGVLVFALFTAMAGVIWSRTLPYLSGREDQATYYSHFQAGEFVADESLKVADFLKQRVAPGDSLFIWGFRPEVYYLSQLNPAVRFIFQFPLVASWYPAEWRKQTVDILWAALPPYVLVLQGDYLPWVTGNNQDSNTDLQGYTELNNWLEFNYVRDSQIGNFLIWRRSSKPK